MKNTVVVKCLLVLALAGCGTTSGVGSMRAGPGKSPQEFAHDHNVCFQQAHSIPSGENMTAKALLTTAASVIPFATLAANAFTTEENGYQNCMAKKGHVEVTE